MKTDKDERSSREVDDPLPPRWVANIVGLVPTSGGHSFFNLLRPYPAPLDGQSRMGSDPEVGKSNQ